MDIISPQALGVGSGIAASTLLWWLLRGKVEEASPDMPPNSPAAYLTPVAKVSKLCVYPVKSCHRIEVDSTDIFKRGLLYDRCIFGDNNGVKRVFLFTKGAG